MVVKMVKIFVVKMILEFPHLLPLSLPLVEIGNQKCKKNGGEKVKEGEKVNDGEKVNGGDKADLKF